MASSIVLPVYFLILSLLVGSPLFRVAHDFCSPGCYHRAATYSSTFLPSLKDGVKGELTAKPTGVLPRDGSARADKGDVCFGRREDGAVQKIIVPSLLGGSLSSIGEVANAPSGRETSEEVNKLTNK